MPLRLLLDENLRSKALLQALKEQQQSGEHPLDVVRVGDPDGPPCESSDERLLVWAAEQRRIVVSLDAATLPDCQHRLVAAGLESPGVVLLRSGLTIEELVELLQLIAYVSETDEWRNMTRWIP